MSGLVPRLSVAYLDGWVIGWSNRWVDRMGLIGNWMDV